jgi:hypothetical protein
MSNTAEALEHSVDSAADTAAPDAIPEPRKPSKATHFVFEHPVFAVKEALFSLSPTTGEPVYNVPLGDVRASLPIDTIASSFGIASGSADAELLQKVKRSLRFVKEIRPNDSIPTELLDGTASWKVEPHHREIARARITVQLVSWMSGKAIDGIDAAELETIAAMPETKKKVQEAFEAVAEKLGLGRAKKHEVIAKFDDLAREMSYIEALRERFGKIQKLYAGFSVLHSLYKRERGPQEDINRVRVLMKRPVEDIAQIFEQFDANTGEILVTLKKFAAQIRYIREVRDDLHQRFMRWDALLNEWSGVVLECGSRVERLIRLTYQFAARHFPLNNDWSLQSR